MFPILNIAIGGYDPSYTGFTVRRRHGRFPGTDVG